VEEPVGQQELQHHNAEVQKLAEDEATKIDVVPK
jgi:deoxyribose-phosphate aldolase